MVNFPRQPEELRLGRDGAQLFRAALSIDQVRDLERTLGGQPRDHAGVRLSGVPALRSALNPENPVGSIAASALGPECLPVRAILFDKSYERNWAVGWHQDRTIAVKERIDPLKSASMGFGPWSVKSGMIHVEPPFDLLASMLTLRVHLDAVTITNAPLLIAPGSHKRGRIPLQEIPRVVEECGVVPCLADAGDIWLYATPIVHASDAAAEPRHRRVLQVDYAIGPLTGGLQWLGV